MRLNPQWPSVFIFILALACGANGAPLDRIAVTVNRHVIAESDILRDLRCAAFIDSRTPDLTAAAKRAAADRLVDQYLVLEDAASVHTQLPGPGAEAPLLAPIRARFASQEAFQAALGKAHISEGELREHLLNGLRLLTYTEARFSTQVAVSEDDLRAEYNKLAAQKGPGSNGTLPDFASSRAQLQELLSSQRTNDALDQWLESARRDARITYVEDALSQSS